MLRKLAKSENPQKKQLSAAHGKIRAESTALYAIWHGREALPDKTVAVQWRERCDKAVRHRWTAAWNSDTSQQHSLAFYRQLNGVPRRRTVGYLRVNAYNPAGRDLIARARVGVLPIGQLAGYLYRRSAQTMVRRETAEAERKARATGAPEEQVAATVEVARSEAVAVVELRAANAELCPACSREGKVAVETMEHFFTCPVAGAAIEIARARVCSTLRDAASKPTTPAAPHDDSARKLYRRELGLASPEDGRVAGEANEECIAGCLTQAADALECMPATTGLMRCLLNGRLTGRHMCNQHRRTVSETLVRHAQNCILALWRKRNGSIGSEPVLAYESGIGRCVLHRPVRVSGRPILNAPLMSVRMH